MQVAGDLEVEARRPVFAGGGSPLRRRRSAERRLRATATGALASPRRCRGRRSLGRLRGRRSPQGLKTRDLWLTPAAATTPKMTAAWWNRWIRGARAKAVHRQGFRRGAADVQGGVSHRANRSLTVAWWRMVVFVLDAGVVADLVSWFHPPTYCSSFVLILCTLYVDCG